MRKAINKKIFFASLVAMFVWHEKAYTQRAPSLPSPPPVSVPNFTPFIQTPQANIPTAQQKEYTQQELEAERARGNIFAKELIERVIAIIAHEEGSENSLPDGFNPLEEYDGKIEKKEGTRTTRLANVRLVNVYQRIELTLRAKIRRYSAEREDSSCDKKCFEFHSGALETLIGGQKYWLEKMKEFGIGKLISNDELRKLRGGK